MQPVEQEDKMFRKSLLVATLFTAFFASGYSQAQAPELQAPGETAPQLENRRPTKKPQVKLSKKEALLQKRTKDNEAFFKQVEALREMRVDFCPKVMGQAACVVHLDDVIVHVTSIWRKVDAENGSLLSGDQPQKNSALPELQQELLGILLDLNKTLENYKDFPGA
jgi:hypothetical protein